MLIQLYKVLGYKDGKYIVELYKNTYCYDPVVLKMGVWKFEDWRMDKWDRTEIDIRKFIPTPADKKLIIVDKKKKKKKVGVDLNLDFDMDVRIDIALENIEKDIRNINNRMHTMQLQMARLANNTNAKGTEKVKVILPDTEKKIMDHVLAEVEKNKYIAENDIKVNNYSVAVIQRTVRNKEILEAFNLQRIRASKDIKKDLGIELETYPFIICSKCEVS